MRLVVAAAAALTMLAPAPVDAATPDPRARRREVQKKRAQVASQINVLKSTDEELAKALDDLEAGVRGQEAQLSSSRQAADSALKLVAAARQSEAETSAHLSQLRSSMREVAVDAYVRGPSRSVSVALDAGSLSEAVRRQQLFTVAVGRGTDLADELRATHEDLGVRRAEVEQAEVVAAAEKRKEEAKLGQLKQTQDAKEKLADGVEARLEASLAEADALATLDSQLAAEINRRQQELARRLASRPGGGRVSGPTRGGGSVSVTNVRGIVVNTQIAAAVESLLEAASASGVEMSGGGYRDSGDQVALRRAHCGSSSYDIYSKPASQCRPPTARPGASMHEQGLAIDFTEGGRTLTRGTSGYRWLSGNASRFGLYNLPSEPWHWSTNGQ